MRFAPFAVLVVFLVSACDPQYVEPDPVADAGVDTPPSQSGWWSFDGYIDAPGWFWKTVDCENSTSNYSDGISLVMARTDKPCLFVMPSIDVSALPDGAVVRLSVYVIPSAITPGNAVPDVAVYARWNAEANWNDIPIQRMSIQGTDATMSWVKPVGARVFSPVIGYVPDRTEPTPPIYQLQFMSARPAYLK